jgi:ABC-type transport system involved in cytochrome c biogenesis permease subunit
MSASALPITNVPARPLAVSRPLASPLDLVNAGMKGLASLKLTVALMAYGILVIYVGTIAQKNADIWQIVRDYFHAWVMWVDINLFFPKEFFWFVPTVSIPAPESLAALNITNFHTIPLPGGLIVGTLMAINLLAAHGWRFKIQANGGRLLAGLGVLAAGLIVGLVVILAGHNTQGFQSKPPFSWAAFWTAFLLCGGLVWLGLVAAYTLAASQKLFTGGVTLVRAIVFAALAVVLAALAVLLGWGLLSDHRPADEALRIVWQLLQGSLAAVVLLAGCILVFRKRGGMVLLHAGIGLLIFNELFVAMTARERQVTLEEGQTTNCLRDIRTTELAIVSPVNEENEAHVVIPRSRLLANLKQNQRLQKAGKPLAYINDPKLPFGVAVVEYHANATVRRLKPSESPRATAGIGLKEVIEPKPAGKGTDTGGAVDLAAAYVKIAEKNTTKEIGTYLLTQLASLDLNPKAFAEQVTVGGKDYDLYLRFKHEYKPYTIKLIDVRKDDYVASDTPRNYSSDIHVVDPEAGINQAVHIKMNDPLRYRGDTFYQADYFRVQSGEGSRLSVVLNRAWMIPYVACMAVVIGMIAHFLIAVTRFISRREDEERAAGEVVTAEVVDDAAEQQRNRKPRPGRDKAVPAHRLGWAHLILPALTAIVFVAYVNSAAHVPEPKKGEFDLYSFGQIPVAHLGRVKPLDSLARDSVRAISGGGRESVKWEEEVPDPKRPGKTKTEKSKLPAIQWFLEVASRTERSKHLRVFRIDNEEVRDIFELKARSGYMYSPAELFSQIPKFEEAVRQAAKAHKDERTVAQRRILELDQALKAYIAVARSFGPPDLPPLPALEELKQDPGRVGQYREDVMMTLAALNQEIKEASAPRLIPLRLDDKQSDEDVWMAYPIASGLAWMNRIGLSRGEPDKLTESFGKMLEAYQASDAATFNAEVRKYQSLVENARPPLYKPNEVAKESYFNAFSPFYVGMPLYVIGFLLAIFGWLFRYRPLNWAALTMILLTFGLHTLALWWRMDISGRPPVTNLYSSAIFIGWACVLAGMKMEAIFRLGLGNIVAAISGFATLLIAYLLTWSGEDNIGVMQAVLDTQFWLATHVVCITLGYASTYLAGLLGVMYILFGQCTPLLNERSRKELGRMIYGITCFAILFSFYGTVLGGLWADDSWGRFWGWDPKENGALIIVLWNALILHARWDKMVSDRGLAVLAVGGNIVTSWSWFGVNQLGIGLHSYGFTSGVAMALVAFGFSQVVLIGLGCLPKSWWWSVQADRDRGELQTT